MMRADSQRTPAETLRQEWVEALRELRLAEQEFDKFGDDFSYRRWAEARDRVGRIYQQMKQSTEDVWRLEEVNTPRTAGLDPLTGLPEWLAQAIGWLLAAGSLIVVVVQIAMWWWRRS